MYSKLKVILLVFTIGFSLSITAVYAQKEKTRVTNFVPVDRRQEGERVFLEGEHYFILEDYSKALFHYQQALEFDPNNATAYFKIAGIYFKNGKEEEDLQKAEQNIERCLKLDTKNKYFYLLASQIYSAHHQFDKSTQVLETMMKEVNDTHEYLYDLAAVLLQNNKLDEALQVYSRAEARLGISELSAYQKERIYLAKNKPKEAIGEGEKLANAYPDEEEYVVSLAELLTQQGQIDVGVAKLEKFIASHPEAGNSKVLLAGLYQDSGDELKSRAYVTKLFDDPQVQLSSKVLMLSTYTAIISQGKNKNDVTLDNFALNLLQKLKTNYPSTADVSLVGGNLYAALEKTDDAQRDYLQAIKCGANNYEVWQNLLLLETRAGLADSVIVHADQALEYNPNQGMIYYYSGIAHLKKKNFTRAVQMLESAKKLSTKNVQLEVEIGRQLGDTYNGMADYEKSDKAYEEALALDPNNKYVLNNYSYYLALQKRHLDKAEKMSSALTKANPDNATYLDTQAWVLFQLGKYKDAKKIMEHIVPTNQNNAIYLEHYGDILFQLGNIDNAVVQWQKAKQLNKESESLSKKITNRSVY